jgi:hypothetical protein
MICNTDAGLKAILPILPLINSKRKSNNDMIISSIAPPIYKKLENPGSPAVLGALNFN